MNIRGTIMDFIWFICGTSNYKVKDMNELKKVERIDQLPIKLQVILLDYASRQVNEGIKVDLISANLNKEFPNFLKQYRFELTSRVKLIKSGEFVYIDYE